MSVEKSVNRKDTVVLIGPLDEIYSASGPIIEEYLSRNWTFDGSRTDPNHGPKMELTFVKEKV